MEETIPLKILMIADGRSPITRRWISMLKPLGYRISLVSSYPCPPVDGVKNLYILPLAFSSFGGSQAGGTHLKKSTNIITRIRPAAQKLRNWLGPWTLGTMAGEFQRIITDEKPDILHALRIPFEGMLASLLPPGIPLVTSTWGNDFTLHAPSTPRMNSLTRKTMQRVSALLSDTRIDVSRAVEWGFDPRKPSLVVPGNGGINLQELNNAIAGVARSTVPTILNPRGLRSYVRSDTFFKSIPAVLQVLPEAQFLCTSMAGQPEAEHWVNLLGIKENVQLLPLLTQEELWRIFARAHVSVSISSHDGTPNTLLEAMACGCLPICGDLPSIREWITPGENGILVDPQDPKALAEAILLGLNSPQLLSSSKRLNSQIINERADVKMVRESVDRFYKDVIRGGKS
jgi:glycosyltransferase involved in cell wall biosynthesis